MFNRFVVILALWALSNTLMANELMPADCVVTPHKVTELSSPILGVLSEVHVEKSDQVAKGDVVAKLESSVEEASVQLALARANINSEIQEGEVNSVFDRRRQKRMDSLFAQKTVSADLKDEAEREAKLAKVRLKQAKDLKTLRQLELDGMKAQLALKTIRSPIDGFVIQRYKSVGEYVEEQPIVSIAQLNPLNIEAIVPIDAFGKINVGDEAEVVVELVSNIKRTAKVVLVDRVGNAASGTFGVRLEMDNPENKIPAGLKCSVKFL